MKFGMAFANIMQYTEPEGARELGRASEAAGFESLWTIEHVVYPDNYGSTYPYDPSGKMPATPETPMPDPLIWLSFVAAATTTLRLATGIIILPQRNPLVLAKQIATLDHMSGGRFELGVGVGWLREEFDALGIGWERRGQRTDEYIEAMRALWDADHASYEGDFVSFSGVSSNPKPVNGRVPIVIGGHTPAAARRAGRLGDGFFPGTNATADLFDLARQAAADAGRDPAAIEMTTAVDVFGDDPVAAVEEAASWGVGRIMVPSFVFALAPDSSDAIALFGENLIDACAGIEPSV